MRGNSELPEYAANRVRTQSYYKVNHPFVRIHEEAVPQAPAKNQRLNQAKPAFRSLFALHSRTREGVFGPFSIFKQT